MTSTSFKDILAWQKAHELVRNFNGLLFQYQLTLLRDIKD